MQTFVQEFRDFLDDWLGNAALIIGLSVALTTCMLLDSYVLTVSSMNTNYQSADRVFVVLTRYNNATNPTWYGKAPAIMRRSLASFGGDISVSPMLNYDSTVRTPGGLSRLTVTLVSSSFPAILGIKAVAGDVAAALRAPGEIVLTEPTAEKIFPGEQAVGKQIELSGKSYRVGAVVKPPPLNTTFTYDALASTESDIWPREMRDDALNSWGSVYGRLIFRAAPGIGRSQLDSELQHAAAISPYVSQVPADQLAKLAGRPPIDVRVDAISEVYFDPDVSPDPGFNNHGNSSGVIGLGLLSLVVLMLAGFNYANIAAARALAHQREISVRKVFGATSRQVSKLFLARAFFYVGISGTLSVALACCLRPWFEETSGQAIESIFTGTNLLLLLFVCSGLSVATAAFPAYVVVVTDAAAGLTGKGAEMPAGGRWALRVTVVIQLWAATFLASSAVVVVLQQRMMVSTDPGFIADGLFHADLPGVAQDDLSRQFVHSATEIVGVRGVTVASDAVGAHDAYFSTLVDADGHSSPWEIKQVDTAYFAVYGVHPSAGRTFDPQRDDMNSSDGIVVNSFATHLLGFNIPQDAIGKQVRLPKLSRSVQIIGVVPDIAHDSLRANAHPLAYLLSDQTTKLTFRLDHDAGSAIEEMTKLWRNTYPNDILEITSAKKVLDAQYDEDVRLAKLLTLAAFVSLSLAAIGVAGTSAQSVHRARRSLVVRRVFGAKFMAVVREGSVELISLAVVALLIAVPGAELFGFDYLYQFRSRISLGAIVPLVVAVLIILLVLISSIFNINRITKHMPRDVLRG